MVNADYSPNVPLKPKTRDVRGLQHDVCGQLLVPIEFDWNDDEYGYFYPNGMHPEFVKQSSCQDSEQQ